MARRSRKESGPLIGFEKPAESTVNVRAVSSSIDYGRARRAAKISTQFTPRQSMKVKLEQNQQLGGSVQDRRKNCIDQVAQTDQPTFLFKCPTK